MSESGNGRAESSAEAGLLNSRAMEVREMDVQSVDETLRMIARMPAPEGLEERVKARLQLAETPGRVLEWPTAHNRESVWAQNDRLRSEWMRSGWARGAAAAAIALVVAGGGWGIYARVAPPQSAKTVLMPQAQPSGVFSEAGAMRRPQTVTRPKALEPVTEPGGKRVIHSQVSKARPGAPADSGVPTPAQ